MISIAAVLALAALGGCGDGEEEPGAGREGAGPLVRYGRSGGIAGVNEQLIVQPDGRATLTAGVDSNPVEFRLSEAELNSLRGSFDEAGFAELYPDYRASTPGADFFQYEIAYGGHTVLTETEAGPPELEPVIAALDRIVGQHYP